jgi:hypothetical protein
MQSQQGCQNAELAEGPVAGDHGAAQRPAGGLDAVVRFRVPATGSYNVCYGDRDVSYIAIRLSITGPTGIEADNDATETVLLDAGTDYYLEIEQTGGALIAASTVTVWAD